MAGLLFKVLAALLVATGAVLYQLDVHRSAIAALALRRAIEPLAAFPYRCRRVYDERLRACEDMWLSDSTRQLFLTCSDPSARNQWMPTMGNYNVSGRNLNDAVVVIDVDKPTADGGFAPRALATPGFADSNGYGHLHLVGMTGVEDDDGSARLWLVNSKPSVDSATGEFLDHHKVGANSTIELFRARPQAAEMEHLKTFAHPQIATPNRVAAVGGQTNAFYFTNDHGTVKVGVRNTISPLLASGDVSFCDDDSTCRMLATGLRLPNGLTKGPHGRIYVPSSFLGVVSVFEPQGDGLAKVDEIDTGVPLDNLSVDSEGTVWAAGLTDFISFFRASKDPYGSNTSATVMRLREKVDGGFQVDKALEDGLAEVLPGSTAVVHDAKTGRLFLSGVFAPFIAVCEPK